MNSLQKCIEYIMDSESEDFDRHCQENDMTRGEALQALTHIYAHAMRADLELEKINEYASMILGELKSGPETHG
jgi:hypothetical protein